MFQRLGEFFIPTSCIFLGIFKLLLFGWNWMLLLGICLVTLWACIWTDSLSHLTHSLPKLI
jgi:hypothetical protein